MLRPWNVSLRDRIDPSRDAPIYMQIIQALIRDIESGHLASGTYLPSTRELAATLGVNRKTVVLAYEDLIAQGWLASAGTRGTTVSSSLPEATPREAPKAPVDQAASADYRFDPPPARPLALAADGAIKVDEGSPDGRLMPTEVLSRAYRTAIRSASRENRLQYRDPRGSSRLREAIAEMLKSERGLPVTRDNICITRGSQNGIFLAAQLLVRAGTAVAVEALTYEPAVAAFHARGAEIVPVALDEGGVDIADLERACRRHPIRAIFLTPHHQFPTTVALRPERRLRLLAIAHQFGFAIIEDDYDHEFHFESQPLLPMAAYAPAQVIYVGSLSKLLLPALRIGYIAAPADVIDAIAHQVSLTDGMGNTLTEDAAAELIENGELRRHARKVRQVYADRRESFAAMLADQLGDIADCSVPDGGLAFWLRFHDPETLARVEARAPGLGLRFAASESYMTRPDAGRGLRLGFGSLDEGEAAKVLQLLRQAATE
ncbi:PLP-dependent aminotransferase family protein [Stakelama saccharophila]|uniref:PLP-dependent aminotransferase family protein n=1 Tax=Stakelama saccharophila TaxID=3075605 RepID=A0ABZ0BA19_9SPHN|nr:PLP-dependent aminotransferase family protein [Stakelama sp. W311]WNO54109.1 PLP-dependent aminotransferase family protein [Stakelama sp. W311]